MNQNNTYGIRNSKVSMRLISIASITVTALYISACIEDKGATESTSTSTSTEYQIPDARPPQVPTQPQPVDPSVPFNGDYGDIGISITGSQLTNLRQITANIKYDSWSFMKVNINADCSGGDFEPVSSTKAVTLPEANLIYTVSVQFTDIDRTGRTPCLTAQVKYDSEGPKILFNKYPSPVSDTEAPISLEYQVDDFSTITSTNCTFLGVTKPCAAGGPYTIGWDSLPEGTYTFTVDATDELGQSSSSSVSWQVVSRTKRLTQTFYLNDYRKVDVIIVIDNSGSMEYEQKNMAQRMSNFLSILRGLDWQIGVVTTDSRDIALGDGRLLPIYGKSGEYIFTSAMDESDAQYRLGMTLQRKETGDSAEQGIKATYRAIERSLDGVNNPFNKNLIREGAHLASLVISDENESANTAKNDPHNLLSFIQQSYGGQKNFSFHSIITRPGDSACLKTNGYSYGERYKVMSELTGGIMGSVCESDYTQQLTGIANGIRDLLKSLTLKCEPLTGYPITVKLDGQVYNESFTVEGVNLRYANELPPGTFTVDYRCLN